MEITYFSAIFAARVPLKAGRAVNAFFNLCRINKYIVADAPKPLASFALVARATAAEWRRSENAGYFVRPLVTLIKLRNFKLENV
jgi:hypothetical protein